MSTTNAAAPRKSAGTIYRAGTLAYNRRQLVVLFFWLLIGDLVFMVGNQFEPRVLPILLKQAGASDAHIAWIVGTLIQVMQLVLNPIYSYNSDRTRSRWGRRIPYLFVVTPFVSLLLVLTPYAPDIAAWLMRYSWMRALAQNLPCPPAVLMYGLMVGVFYLFYTGTSSIYFYLFRDVVPESHMGRFLALFRIIGALATFIFNYWLFGLGVKFPKEVFLGMALINFAGFMAMCWFVREGEYPPATSGAGKTTDADGAPSPKPALPVRAARSVVTYFRECFSDPLNWWTYLCRLMVYASMTASSFLVFFPMHELGMDIDEIGRALSWPSLVWIAVAFPVGLLLDKWKVFRVLRWALWIQSLAYLLSFFLIRGDTSFLVSSLVTGVMYWAIMLCQFMLGQEVFPALYLGQFFSANVVLQSVVIALVVSPFCGWFFDAFKGVEQTLALPLLGTLKIGPYRYIMLILGAIFSISLFSLYRVEAIMKKRGLATTRAK
ncbi:MAG: MFS transporter [Opitutaceae bacterium]|jgi:MFS family permease|nr:MFS transporter [Opitutaceae bacterium]